MLTDPPTIDDVKEWMRVTDDIDDVALQEGLNAAVAYQTRYYCTGSAEVPYPDDLRLAAMLRAARYLARRSSPDGLVGMGGDLGVVQVAFIDRDIRELEAPWNKPSVA